VTDEDHRKAPRGRRIAAALLVLLLTAGLAALWSARKPIARHYLDAMLTDRGVRARYTIGAIGPVTQRIDHLVIGDPASPDLTIDHAEMDLGWGMNGAGIAAIRARGVRLNGRLADGRVSLGAIDRLLPKPGGAPFRLPAIDVDLDDARMRLATPAGTVGLSLEGQGNLAGGFDGHLAAVASTLSAGGCRVSGANAFLAVSIRDRQPILDGPVRAASVACPEQGVAVEAPWIALKARASETLARWRGAAGLAASAIAQGGNRIERPRGKADFAGDLGHMEGTLSLASGPVRTAPARARAARFDGAYALGGGGALELRGDLGLDGATIAPAAIRRLHDALIALEGTPPGPLGRAFAEATVRAARDADATAAIGVHRDRDGTRFSLATLDATSRSGARLNLTGGEGLSYDPGPGRAAVRLDTVATLTDGGFPALRIALSQSAPGAPMVGDAVMAPFAAGGARLVLTPVRFAPGPGGATRFTTTATLDGPLGDGRVTGLRLPLAGRFGPGGVFALGEGCVPLDFATLSIAGLRLDAARLPLCPTVGGALVARTAGGALRGGASIAAPHLAGRLGASPVTLAARVLRLDIATRGFVVEDLAARLGEGGAETTTRLDIAHLTGAPGAKGVDGGFEGAEGGIANVPLRLSDARGTWRLAGGALTLAGGLSVGDTDDAPRFHMLASRDVRLDLKGGMIHAAATLDEPRSGRAVMAVTLAHDLADGHGGAQLAVPGLRFDKALQPEALTPLTLGVVANVAGLVTGEGRIDWNRQGVTSNGEFRTDSLDLAAAFGPVKALAGTIRFTDLLGLRTPPGQKVTLGEVNPGIAVHGGEVGYQLLADRKVAIEGGRWPFSGGELILEPGVVDLGHPVARHLTFRVAGLDAARFIEQFKLDNIAVTGVFDGVLPMVFDADGGRIVGGRLVVRQGGGRLAYVGRVSNAELGTYGKLAFDALKSMRYDSLAIELDGALDGEIVSRVIFSGVNDGGTEAGGAGKGSFTNLNGVPFKFNIAVRAPFRGLLDTASDFTDPAGLLHRGPVQTQESGNKAGKP